MPDTMQVTQVPMQEHTPSAIPNKPKNLILRRIGVISLILLVIILIVFGIFAVTLMPLKDVYAKTQEVMVVGKEVGVALKSQNLDQMKEKLAATRVKMKELETTYGRVTGLSSVPFLGLYIQDGSHAIKAGFAGLDALENAVLALEPHADLLGLKGKSKFVQGTADDRIQTAVKTMNALLPKVTAIAENVKVLQKELVAIDPSRYPENVKGLAVQSQIQSTKDVIDNAATLFVNAQPFLMNLPKLLGEPTEKRYLVLFQNDKELRPTGGFLTAYAQFRLVHGKMILEKADDIYKLDASLKKEFKAPREILTFHKGVYTLHIRDSNLSPDFKLSMQQFEEMYNTASGKEKIDGIWAVDTHVLVEALKILGPMYLSGKEFSADNDKRCDCPKAVYELEDYSTRPVGYVREDRKDVIGILLRDLLQKALGVSPSQYWGRLFQMLFSEINQKHVLAYFKDSAVQKSVESFNLAGRIMTSTESAALLKYQEGTWDYLHVNNSNMAGAKSNLFVSEKITKDTTVESNGALTTRLTVEYKNPFKGSDCGLESGGLCLNAPLRNWVRVYVPRGSKLVESKGTQSPKDGKPVLMDTYDSLDKTVFEGFLVVNPLGTARLDVTYTSTVKDSVNGYKLLIQKQPGTDKQEYILKLNGKDRKKFELLSDTEVQL
ncbi:DUF4012 domain-containing protein [Candidatus Gottesmanbacteria bacterium]|nr:DUF4012 domain-containing protein [Candidatus Gottesmanbacteria bacterium]